MPDALVQATPLPSILQVKPSAVSFPLDNIEVAILSEARDLLEAGFAGHALLNVWNAAVTNLRRRVEAYGVDLFQSVIANESGRKKFDPKGATLVERWEAVDEFVLLTGAGRLGLLPPKALKTLETINWMRNHASPAHPTDDGVTRQDVISLAMLLEGSLFSRPLPDPGHSVASLFGPIKAKPLDADAVALLNDQIRSCPPPDQRTAFGFLLDQYLAGTDPASSNSRALLPTAWEVVGDEVRKIAGERYHVFGISPETDTSGDKGAKTRLLELLVQVKGIRFIPDANRAVLYRHAALALRRAKNTGYGWTSEERAAQQLQQFGPHVPNIAFEEVYQEILAVWCGNYWGRSGAAEVLVDFVDTLDTDRIRLLVRLFTTSTRAQEELSHAKPKARALELLEKLRPKLTLQAHVAEVDLTAEHVKKL